MNRTLFSPAQPKNSGARAPDVRLRAQGDRCRKGPKPKWECGQKQRILISRALYKDPDYLFFDEATNSLDTLNEQKIVSALDNVFKDKTVIVVAHRLSTIRKADQIVVMQDGQIVEIGNHDSLMNLKRRYFQLVQSQLDLSSTVLGEENKSLLLPEMAKNEENGQAILSPLTEQAEDEQ